MSYNGTVFCSYCGEKGHNRRGCTKLKEYVKENPDSYLSQQYNRTQEKARKRSCSYCNDAGHNRATCPVRKSHIARAIKVNKEYCFNLVEHMDEIGIRVGALVKVPGQYPDYEQSSLGMITGFKWSNANFLSLFTFHNGDFISVKKINQLNSPYGWQLRLPKETSDHVQRNHELSETNCVLSIESTPPMRHGPVPHGMPKDFLSGEHGIKEMFKDVCWQTAPVSAIERLEEEYFNKI